MGIFSKFRKNEQKNNSESVSLSPKEKLKKWCLLILELH